MDAQVVPLQAGAAPSRRAALPKVTCAAPSRWPRSAGTAWHSAHATAPAIAPPSRCARCAPTARSVVAVSPCVPSGGAALGRSAAVYAATLVPWQNVQFDCQAVPPWQPLQETPEVPPP
ncbi:hypothetical protein PSR1_02558 [Anaeromyxobacter sp. PSR-1]|nr:hypothetical protein PSR1_02558 [Anaeromyxobacter sp. PSR-1]